MIDILFAVIICVAIFKGYRKGLIIAVFSILAFIVGLAAALKLSAAVAAYLQHNISLSGKWLPFISFTLVFIGVVFLVRMGAKLIESTFEMAMLGWINRIGGVLLFAVLYLLIFSVFLFYTDKVHLFEQETLQASKTYPFLQPWGPKIIEGFGKYLPVFKDMFTELSNYFASLSNTKPQ